MAAKGKKVTDRKDDRENTGADPREGGAGAAQLTEKQQERIRQSIELMAKTVPMKIDELLPYQRNQKDHPEEQIRNLANSLRRFGWVQPVVIDENNVIVIGHGRVLAAKLLGLADAPVVHTVDLTEDEIRELRIIDNKLNESAWNKYLEEDLKELTFEGFEALDWDGFGEINDPESDEQLPEEDEFDGTVPAETEIQRGDIFQLGRHRLMCGDSTSREEIEALLNGNTAQLALTDPPYGINAVKVSGGGTAQSGQGTGRGKAGGVGTLRFKPGGTIGGTNQTHFRSDRGGSAGTPEKNRITPEAVVPARMYLPVKGDESTETAKAYWEASRELAEHQIIFGGNYFTDFLMPSRCWVVWDKNNTGNFADAELAWTDFDKGVKLYKFTWNGLQREGSREVEGIHRVHPTQKPVGMLGMILRDFSQEGDNVLDCFGGSGSTLMACEQMGRSCFMMEYEAGYVNVIIARWEKFTGQKAVKIS